MQITVGSGFCPVTIATIDGIDGMAVIKAAIT